MFRTEKDKFGEDVLIATFGHGSIYLGAAVTEDSKYTLYIRDNCEAAPPGTELPGGVMGHEGTRAIFEFDNLAGLDALIDHLGRVRKLVVDKVEFAELCESVMVP
jgi:hypothetical protein